MSAADGKPAGTSAGNLSVAMISSFPPRQCGIACFARDLSVSLKTVEPGCEVGIVDLEGTGGTPVDPGTVNVSSAEKSLQNWFQLNSDQRSSYRQAARVINLRRPDVVCLQHEYGLFGGPAGEHILDLVESLDRPLVTVFHTILQYPTRAQKRVLSALAEASAAVVTMSKTSVTTLKEIYGVPRDKVTPIPHGTPDADPALAGEAKRALGVEGETVISTFGLLSRGKGLEYALLALSRVVETHPNLRYYILGATHPKVVLDEGESYREHLASLAERIGLAGKVIFVNRYLSREELFAYLLATDIYLTPYLNPEQTSSGTLAYAVGFGKAVVSTPYVYAAELLGGGRGLLCEFRDPDSMAAQVELLVSRPDLSDRIRRQAYQWGRQTVWEKVAERYMSLFRAAVSEVRPVSAARPSIRPRLREGVWAQGAPGSESRATLLPTTAVRARQVPGGTGELSSSTPTTAGE
ncbi:MAG: glycosyltransferase family 4 protein [Firmicutes bacterium]|nr:glycosyltransferase family 4 protein [Bacillota bacterium]